MNEDWMNQDNDETTDSTPQTIDTTGDGVHDATITYLPGGKAMPNLGLTPDFNADFNEYESCQNPSQTPEEFDNWQYVDSDGDGEPDAIVKEFDENQDGTPEIVAVRTEKGNFINVAVDADKDNTAESAAIFEDFNKDGIADRISVIQPITERVTPEQPRVERTEESVVEQPNQFLSRDYPNYIPASFNSETVVGDPGKEMQFWHEQTKIDTCAIASQEFILESITGREFSEDELRQQAMENGWYTPQSATPGGTPMDDIGKLLEINGIPVDRKEGCTLDDLSEKLNEGEKVIVSLDSSEILTGQNDDQLLINTGANPARDADHAVQVIGIDNSNPQNPMIILNDPAHPDGKGMMVSADVFMNAWADGGNYMVSTDIAPNAIRA